MITLYNSNFSCSFAIHIVLELLKVEYSVENVVIGSQEFKKINPRGSVPAIIDSENNNGTMTQVLAILKYLLKKYPNDLGTNGDILEEYQLDNILSFLNSDFHKSFGGFFATHKFTSKNDDEILNDIKNSSIKQIKANVEFLESFLNGKEFLVLNKLTIADIYAFVILRWANYALGEDFEKYSNINNFMKNISKIPEVQKITKIHETK